MHGEMLKYYSRNKFFLSMLGIWPYQSKMIKHIIPVSFLYIAWGDMTLTVEATINNILLIGSVVKYLNIVINNNKVKNLLEMMEDHWQLFQSKCELHVLRYYGNINQLVTKYYSAYINIIVAVFFLIPLKPRILDLIIPLNESRPYIFICGGEWGVDKVEYYYPILFHCLICIIMVLDVCIRLENIHDKTEHIEDEMPQKHLEIKEHYSEYHKMIACLKKHQIIYIYNCDVIILALNIIILSLSGLQILSKLGETEEMIRFGFIAIGATTHLITMCIPGQLLANKSEELFDKAYNTRWYMFSSKTTKLLSILLHRTLEPCVLTAENMAVMSVETFSSVMQTAMSYFFTTFLSMS
ncbi:Odorant receptor 333 [Nylanderia fulva]|uniref:Odorant receptor n=1 Tax=Nylanderia fulva TaxID=613905 RepID=A0A6G1LP94_9HYME|nr:Odorant receptor 333 [Nylanderia fulva]